MVLLYYLPVIMLQYFFFERVSWGNPPKWPNRWKWSWA